MLTIMGFFFSRFFYRFDDCVRSITPDRDFRKLKDDPFIDRRFDMFSFFLFGLHSVRIIKGDMSTYSLTIRFLSEAFLSLLNEIGYDIAM